MVTKIRSVVALGGGGGLLEKGMKDFSRVMQIFFILILVINIKHLSKLIELNT